MIAGMRAERKTVNQESLKEKKNPKGELKKVRSEWEWDTLQMGYSTTGEKDKQK